MVFFSGELRNFDLCKMNKDIVIFSKVKLCCDSISTSLCTDENNNEIEEILKYNGKIYYMFGSRKGEYLFCVNGQKYFINDEVDESAQGINMSDAYINSYEDINLGFLISYNNGNIEIQSAIEGESVICRRCEPIEDCGDLNNKMQIFISKYIL